MSERYNAKELEFCTSCEADLCMRCAIDKLKNSRYGRLLYNNPPRFGAWAWDNKARFREYMGPDIDPVMHGPHQAVNVALPMVELQNKGYFRRFTREEAKILFLAHILHDAHEGISGDVPAPQKTLQSNLDELELNQTVVADILGDSPFLPHLREVMDPRSYSFVGRAFQAGELCGYFLTGLRAWALRNHADLSPEEREKCEDMGRVVILADVSKLAAYDEYAFVNWLISGNRVAIEEVKDTRPSQPPF